MLPASTFDGRVQWYEIEGAEMCVCTCACGVSNEGRFINPKLKKKKLVVRDQAGSRISRPLMPISLQLTASRRLSVQPSNFPGQFPWATSARRASLIASHAGGLDGMGRAGGRQDGQGRGLAVKHRQRMPARGRAPRALGGGSASTKLARLARLRFQLDKSRLADRPDWPRIVLDHRGLQPCHPANPVAGASGLACGETGFHSSSVCPRLVVVSGTVAARGLASGPRVFEGWVSCLRRN